MSDEKPWDAPDVRRDYRKTTWGFLLIGLGAGTLFASFLIAVLFFAFPTVDPWVRGAAGTAVCAVLGGLLTWLGSRLRKEARSVKVSGTWGIRGGWRKRRL